MKKINLKVLIITCIACVLPIIIGMYFFNSLPESIVIHWGIDNKPNGFFPKVAFIFGMPLIMSLVQIFCCIITDLSDRNQEANKKTISVLKWIIPIITMVLYIVTIMYALGSNVDIRKIVMIILGILFIILGNYIPKTKNTFALGLKKFMIKNSDFESKISRISGYILILDGILFLLSMAFSEIVSLAIVCIVILEGLIIFIYSLKRSKSQ